MEIFLFILGIVFKGCLNGGPRQRAETDARYSQQLQTGTRPESVLQDGSPPWDWLLRRENELGPRSSRSQIIFAVLVPPL